MATTQKINVARVYKDFDMAFTKNSLSGDINKKLDVNAVKQSIRTLLLSQPHERPFHPELGSTLWHSLFELMRPGMEIGLERQIEQQIANYEPRVRLTQVNARPDYDNNSYNVQIRFFVIGINEPQELTVSLTRLR